MTTPQLESLKQDMLSYKRLKDSVSAKVKAMEESVSKRTLSSWHLETETDELYRDIYVSPERTKFIQLEQRTQNDPEFEEEFRKLALMIFVPPQA